MTYLKIKDETMLMTVNASSPTTLQKMSQEQFYEFCCLNPDLRIERTAQGEVIVMPPTFSDTGNRNFKIAQQLANWSDQDGTGDGFDSSAGFTLPNGATRSPDAAWMKLDRWNALTDEQKASFASICPDFVIELRSTSDTLKGLKEKMQEYIENGVRLGLLIDRKNLTVYCYRADGSVNVLNNPTIVDCSPELPGFVLQMARIW
jgi:Uma2 family endonuclease